MAALICPFTFNVLVFPFMCRYEESQLHKSIYQLDVKLLGADAKTVIKQHSFNPEENLENYSHTWKKVAHTCIFILIYS